MFWKIQCRVENIFYPWPYPFVRLTNDRLLSGQGLRGLLEMMGRGMANSKWRMAKGKGQRATPKNHFVISGRDGEEQIANSKGRMEKTGVVPLEARAHYGPLWILVGLTDK